jgi:hypothetical protein
MEDVMKAKEFEYIAESRAGYEKAGVMGKPNLGFFYDIIRHDDSQSQS